MYQFNIVALKRWVPIICKQCSLTTNLVVRGRLCQQFRIFAQLFAAIGIRQFSHRLQDPMTIREAVSENFEH